MNRRQVLLSSLCLGVASLLPAEVVSAEPVLPSGELGVSDSLRAYFHAMQGPKNNIALARWTIDAWNSPHRPVVEKWIEETVDGAALYCYGDGMIADRVVALKDTDFEIHVGGKVFNYVTGLTDEVGLEIVVTEVVNDQRVKFAPIGLASTHGLTITSGPNKDVYVVRKPLLRYEEERDLRYALGDTPGSSPNSRVSYDMRWLEDDLKALKAAV